MNNYEKRLFLDYFDKLLYDIDFKDYNFDDVIDFFIKEFKIDRKIFQID